MLKLAVTAGRRSKVKMSPGREASLKPSDVVEIAVETNDEDYVPDKVSLRARIADRIFTGRTTRKNLDKLELDPKIVSVDVGRPLHPIKSPGDPGARGRSKTIHRTKR